MIEAIAVLIIVLFGYSVMFRMNKVMGKLVFFGLVFGSFYYIWNFMV